MEPVATSDNPARFPEVSMMRISPFVPPVTGVPITPGGPSSILTDIYRFIPYYIFPCDALNFYRLK